MLAKGSIIEHEIRIKISVRMYHIMPNTPLLEDGMLRLRKTDKLV